MAQITQAQRSDSVEQKLRLFQSAYAAGNHDLALSLADSLRGSLQFERSLASDPPGANLGADDFEPVDRLPAPWAAWAHGWAWCKPVTVREDHGIARAGEPVDIVVAFRSDQTTDPHREVRMAHIDSPSASPREISCQIYNVVRQGQARICHLVFLADVPANDQTQYLILYGNPNAELPQFTTDLSVAGEGYGLDITNRHFVARLSRQMGQLERLTLRREHGLEHYAGGQGHGEPPGIDWAHDYVDEDNFQKIRVTAWPQCPDYQVIKGPLCVRVRRWGFPYSPLHPVYTPSRMHMDLTYVFYAGLPYFYKIATMSMVKDFSIRAMRDDEWVFSGYSFTTPLWIGADGKVHEGDVPKEQAENLWGTGFYNTLTRDAFVAIWLEHSSKNCAEPAHRGAPSLSYKGHGQIWARYPANQTQFKAGASMHQRNAYLLSPYPQDNPHEKIQTLRRQLLNPLQVQGGQLDKPSKPTASAPLARDGETPDTASLKAAVWQAMRGAVDEQFYEIDANMVDMGYIYDVRVRAGVVTILMTMPHRGRPHYRYMVQRDGSALLDGIIDCVKRVNGVRDVLVDFTWDPPWTVARLTDQGRAMLGLPPA